MKTTIKKNHNCDIDDDHDDLDSLPPPPTIKHRSTFFLKLKLTVF